MVAPADQPRRVLHTKPPLSATAMGAPLAAWNSAGSATGRDHEEALARLRDLVEMELSHRSDHLWPLYAVVVPVDVPVTTDLPRQPQPGEP